MKTPASRSAAAPGFTLLEMMAVMSIMVLVIGIGFASFSLFSDEDPFEKPVEHLTRMSKFALNAAALQHRGMTIQFDKTGFSVTGVSVPGGSRFDLPPDMALLARRWGGKGWEKVEGFVWHFGEQGICEPLKFRLQTKDSSREITIHPLTGGLTD